MSRLRFLVLALPLCALGCLAGRAGAQAPPGAPAVPAGLQDSIAAAVRSAHAHMQRAAESLDANALYRFVLDSPTPPIIEDGTVYGERASALVSTSNGLGGLSRISYHYTRQHVTVLSPTLALWVGEGSASALRLDGNELGGPFAETVLFALRDGEWRVLHAHRSTPNVR